MPMPHPSFGLQVGWPVLGSVVLAAYYDQDPSWVEGIGRVVGALSVPFAGLAASNVPPAQPPVETVTDRHRRS